MLSFPLSLISLLLIPPHRRSHPTGAIPLDRFPSLGGEPSIATGFATEALLAPGRVGDLAITVFASHSRTPDGFLLSNKL
jgi:hypothetical protein